MANNTNVTATYVASTTLTGISVVLSSGEPYLQDTAQTTLANTNAPPPEQFSLQASTQNLILLPPTSYTFSRVQLMPSLLSTNSKTVLGVNTSTLLVDLAGLPGWTSGSITVPAVPGGMIVIFSTSAETIIAAYS